MGPELGPVEVAGTEVVLAARYMHQVVEALVMQQLAGMATLIRSLCREHLAEAQVRQLDMEK